MPSNVAAVFLIDVYKRQTVENMVEVYYNSGQFQNTLEYLEKFFPDAFSIYERLGSFYMEKGYGDVSHTRMRRYEILLEFLEDMPEISVDQVKDQVKHKNLPAAANYCSSPTKDSPSLTTKIRLLIITVLKTVSR